MTIFLGIKIAAVIVATGFVMVTTWRRHRVAMALLDHAVPARPQQTKDA